MSLEKIIKLSDSLKEALLLQKELGNDFVIVEETYYDIYMRNVNGDYDLIMALILNNGELVISFTLASKGIEEEIPLDGRISTETMEALEEIKEEFDKKIKTEEEHIMVKNITLLIKLYDKIKTKSR
jgi:hypothetical protein